MDKEFKEEQFLSPQDHLNISGKLDSVEKMRLQNEPVTLLNKNKKIKKFCLLHLVKSKQIPYNVLHDRYLYKRSPVEADFLDSQSGTSLSRSSICPSTSATRRQYI